MLTHDFEYIAKQYPKAFWLLKEWVNNDPYYEFDYVRESGKILITARDGSNDNYFFNPRDLEAFFDEQGIIGEVSYSDMHGGVFYVHVRDKKHLAGLPHNHSSRTEALIAQYTKQFEILDHQLTTQEERR